MNTTQLIASISIVSACTLLAVYTEAFKNLFVQLLLAGFIAVVLSNETPTPPVMIWSTVGGLLYVLCVDLIADALNTSPHTPQTMPTDPTPQRQEPSIYDLFEFELIGGEQ